MYKIRGEDTEPAASDFLGKLRKKERKEKFGKRITGS